MTNHQHSMFPEVEIPAEVQQQVELQLFQEKQQLMNLKRDLVAQIGIRLYPSVGDWTDISDQANSAREAESIAQFVDNLLVVGHGVLPEVVNPVLDDAKYERYIEQAYEAYRQHSPMEDPPVAESMEVAEASMGHAELMCERCDDPQGCPDFEEGVMCEHAALVSDGGVQ